jgi:hypothetical protein
MFVYPSEIILLKGKITMKTSFIIFLGFCFLIGCGDDWKAEIESDTTWIAECKIDGIAYRTIEESGNKFIDLRDDEQVCVEVWKTTEEGYLKLTIFNDNPGRLGSDEASWAKTTRPYGEVERCTHTHPDSREDEY